MEGPSILIAAEQLAPFIGKTLLQVNGNTKIEKERMSDKKITDIFSWGKHLVFQFDSFALRVHFMLYGSFQAVVEGQKVEGDYPAKNFPRLQFIFDNGHINFFYCSLRYLEDANAKKSYDYTIDILSKKWSHSKALASLLLSPKEEIADMLLDQTIFAGVGNIIKNEVLFIEKVLPTRSIESLSTYKLKKIIATSQRFSKQFYIWKKALVITSILTVFGLKFDKSKIKYSNCPIGVLSQNYQIYKKSKCPRCQSTIRKEKTGFRKRFSFFCPHCQK